MEQLYRDHTPTEIGNYLVLTDYGVSLFTLCNRDESFIYDTHRNVKISRVNWMMEGNFEPKQVLNIKNIQDCVMENQTINMAHRLQLLNKTLVLRKDGEEVKLKVVSKFLHIHCYTIFRCENLETRTMTTIEVRGRDDIVDYEKIDIL